MFAYKTYVASCFYNETTDKFQGRVSGIRDSITFEGSTMKEFLSEFYKSVDSYEETRKEFNPPLYSLPLDLPTA